jgi:hypothetical protein
MREAAIPEPDDSPLFGFIRFRRRNVLVKYVPSGCSRVLMGEWSTRRERQRRGGEEGGCRLWMMLGKFCWVFWVC